MGLLVGALVDVDAMGLLVRALVGVAVGVAVGAFVGVAVGAFVGVAVGASVGAGDRFKPNSTGEWSEQRAGDCPSK